MTVHCGNTKATGKKYKDKTENLVKGFFTNLVHKYRKFCFSVL